MIVVRVRFHFSDYFLSPATAGLGRQSFSSETFTLTVRAISWLCGHLLYVYDRARHKLAMRRFPIAFRVSVLRA